MCECVCVGVCGCCRVYHHHKYLPLNLETRHSLFKPFIEGERKRERQRGVLACLYQECWECEVSGVLIVVIVVLYICLFSKQPVSVSF